MIESRHISFVLSLAGLLLVSSCSKPNETILFQQVKSLSKSGEYVQAESLITEIIHAFPGSPNVDVYYKSAFAVLKMHRDSLSSIQIAKRKRQPRSINYAEPKGTINILLRATDPTPEQQAVRSKILKLGEEYLARHQQGAIRGLVLRELLQGYVGTRLPRFFELAQVVSDSGELQDRALASFYLGLYARAGGKFRDAASHFLSFVELSPDSSDKAKGFLYTADCFYMVGDIDTALIYLNRVNAIESTDRERLYSDMAESWRPAYVTPNSSLSSRQQFVHIDFQ